MTAVGNAGGTGQLSAADGEVTALRAAITTASEGGSAGQTLRGLIETDADVVPGDSGGPLVDEEGEVVGIDTAASSGGDIDGYAIPIATALTAVEQIRAGEPTGTVRIGARAFLGVQLADGALPGASGEPGAVVAGVVDGSAADRAGLAAGDLVTALDGRSVTGAGDLTDLLADHRPGDRVILTWTSADGTERATVTLGENPAA